MSDYPFQLIQHQTNEPIQDKAQLLKRPFVQLDQSFQADSKKFFPGDQLETAINTCIAIGEPLLITGESGTGKTQSAYYTAYKLGIEPVIHFQVKSDSTAKDMLYYFDTVRYFYDAQLPKNGDTTENKALNKKAYIEPRALWNAFWQGKKSGLPRILLIDEIDKAPRDFPNDLLLELDKMEFVIQETGETISAPKNLRPIVFITSNSERRLPEPFLRRCVYHHINFSYDLVKKAIASRRDEFGTLSNDFLEMAVDRFMALRERNLRKKPATGELIVWLRILGLHNYSNQMEALSKDLSQLPYLGTLLKDRQDIEELTKLT